VYGIIIRFEEERWTHIVTEHPEVEPYQSAILSTIENPERIFQGGIDEKLAVKSIEEGKWLVVVYRELEQDGYVITAFLTRRWRSLNRRRVLWPR
jgi:hypothetical protein